MLTALSCRQRRGRREYGRAVARLERIQFELFVIGAEQQVMRERSGIEAAAHFRPRDQVGRLVVREATLPRQGLPVGEERLAARHELGILAETLQFRFAIRAADQQRPGSAEVLLQFELVAQDLRSHRPIARLAEEARVRDDAENAIARHHAAIEGDLLIGPFELIGNRRVVAKPGKDRRRSEVAFLTEPCRGNCRRPR